MTEVKKLTLSFFSFRGSRHSPESRRGWTSIHESQQNNHNKPMEKQTRDFLFFSGGGQKPTLDPVQTLQTEPQKKNGLLGSLATEKTKQKEKKESHPICIQVGSLTLLKFTLSAGGLKSSDFWAVTRSKNRTLRVKVGGIVRFLSRTAVILKKKNNKKNPEASASLALSSCATTCF